MWQVFLRDHDLRTLSQRFDEQAFKNRIKRSWAEYSGGRCRHAGGRSTQGICGAPEASRLPEGLFQHILWQSSRDRFGKICVSGGVIEPFQHFGSRKLRDADQRGR